MAEVLDNISKCHQTVVVACPDNDNTIKSDDGPITDELVSGPARDIDSLPCGVFCYEADRDGPQRFSYVSQSMLSMLGFQTVKEFLVACGGSFRSFVYTDDRDRVMNEIYTLTDLRGSDYCEYRVRRADQTLLWVYDAGRLIVDENGCRWFWVIIINADNVRMGQLRARPQYERRIDMLAHIPGIITFGYDVALDRLEISAVDEQGILTESVVERCQRGNKWRAWVGRESASAREAAWSRLLSGASTATYDMRSCLIGGRFKWYRAVCASIANSTGEVKRIIGRLEDVDLYVRREDSWREQAAHDQLTGLLNHESLMREVQNCAEHSHIGALFMIDIDGFKQVNDNFGHLVGDRVLSKVASVIRRVFRSHDVIGRFGGDEFTVFVSGMGNEETLRERGDNLRLYARNIDVDSELQISLSVGVAVYNGRPPSAEELVHEADIALYAAKEDGKNTTVVRRIST